MREKNRQGVKKWCFSWLLYLRVLITGIFDHSSKFSVKSEGTEGFSVAIIFISSKV